MTIRKTALAAALSIPLGFALVPSAMAQKHDHQDQGDGFEQMEQKMEMAKETTDPAERQKLMQGHMQMMQEKMKSMRGMMDKQGGMMSGDMQEHMQKMQEHMDMMQKMMMDMPDKEADKKTHHE